MYGIFSPGKKDGVYNDGTQSTPEFFQKQAILRFEMLDLFPQREDLWGVHSVPRGFSGSLGGGVKIMGSKTVETKHMVSMSL